MTKNEIEGKIKKILVDNNELLVNPDNISLDCNLESIGINSILLIKIIVAIESEFEFEFNDEDLMMDRFTSVNSLKSYIIEKKGYEIE